MMRSIERLLRNLADEDVSMDPNFRARLRDDLHMAAHYHRRAFGGRWRSLGLLALSAILLMLFLNPSIAVNTNEWLFGAGKVPVNNSMYVQQPSRDVLQQWVAQSYPIQRQVGPSPGKAFPTAVETVVGETYFVLRQVELNTGEMVMVLSEVKQPYPNNYRMY